MSGGTFEAVTLRLGVLHALREIGVLGLERCARDRALRRQIDDQLLAWRGPGMPTPADLGGRIAGKRHARSCRRESPQGPLVLKPLFGSQGRGLQLIRTADELPAPDEVAGVYYLQRYLGAEGTGGFRDFRLLVSRGRVIAAMARHAAGWITNVKQGGRPLPSLPDGELKDLAVRATEAVGGRVLPASTSCTTPMDARPCSRSTACRPGRACRR